MRLHWGYLYDADGARVAKGTITTMSCDPATNGFQFTKSYVLGPGGEDLTTLDGSNTWLRTNVYVGGKLMATYDQAGLHFHLSDPLGTRRGEVSAGGCLSTWTGLAFGNGINQQGSCPDPTEQHFTGKERDI